MDSPTFECRNPKAPRNHDDEYPLLTREDITSLDSSNPSWRWFRLTLIGLFWLTFFGLIVATALYIAFMPRCPPRPEQKFWQSNTLYWVNPFSFKDSNADLVGDLKGLMQATAYIRESVGTDVVILTPMSPWYPRNLKNTNKVGFKAIHSALGTIEDFNALVRKFRKRGMKLVVSLDFNSVPLSHELAKPEFLTPATSAAKFCRTGMNCTVMVGGKNFYSSYGSDSGLVDLDLKSKLVMEEVKNATTFWLSKGADGILLTDAAFYVEGWDCNYKSWSAGFPTCKLYTPGTISVIQQLRKAVDEVSESSQRPRVLIADPGNTGYGAEKEQLLLGTDEAPGAHLVISRQFSYDPGMNNSTSMPSLEDYHLSTNGTNLDQMALTIATPSERPYSSVLSTAAIFLLPGTPIVYAGTEIGWGPLNIMPPKSLYPFGEAPIIGDVASSLPMPWDSHGAGFSEADEVTKAFQDYMLANQIDETVETASAVGRGPNILQLIKSLIQLRKESPSLLWGELTFLPELSESEAVQIFKRSATGFDSILAVIVDANGTDSVVDFSSQCSSLTPLIVYPPRDVLPVGTPIDTSVFFTSGAAIDLYVFRCVV